jgi:hypothetical protein
LDLKKNSLDSETVEKVPSRLLGEIREKNDLTECATINDITIMRGHETPKSHPLTILKGFSTVSAEIGCSKMFQLTVINVATPHLIPQQQLL